MISLIVFENVFLEQIQVATTIEIITKMNYFFRQSLRMYFPNQTEVTAAEIIII